MAIGDKCPYLNVCQKIDKYGLINSGKHYMGNASPSHGRLEKHLWFFLYLNLWDFYWLFCTYISRNIITKMLERLNKILMYLVKNSESY